MKKLDLDPSEWSREGKREPILGPNGKHFLIIFLLGFPVGAFVTLLVTGEFPYWLQPFLQ